MQLDWDWIKYALKQHLDFQPLFQFQFWRRLFMYGREI